MGKRKTKNTDKKKIKLVFDESKRKEFLCGFRKRKLERKKKAKEEMERMLKEEKKRIRQENKESYKKLVVSSRPIPDIEQLLQEEYEDEDVNVKIVELSADTLQKKDIVIGDNKPKQTVDKVTYIKKKKELPQKVPGMGSDEESVEEASEVDNDVNETNDTKLKTKKEVKQMLKRQATKKIQKSKVFQMKSKLDRIQNKKKSQQKKGHIAKVKSDSKKNKSRKKSHKKKQVK
ncbi:PREDICTED: nucleolar protein 12 [Papilio xuthus]|uniref:Nucleolar protein 12 n=1 Tax=Papilio xuthus TaxID=66420 RepID=A0A194PI91_PAPXU|nr:PREDICTED: nucleolar protein 12 [Papilio xuthus]KPI93126.1 Nucleolar protein 12 [Papilio xuthus]